MDPFEKLKRRPVRALDLILGKPITVLDDGFVRVIDYMGSDASVVQAARVSYGKGTKKVREDETLIRYLMRHRHTTPFEMCEITLHVRVPMDAWRQWIRHRTASVNEYSTRYSIAIDAAQATRPEEWRIQAKSNRQGSEGFLDKKTGRRFSEQESRIHELARAAYNERLEAGVAREQARKDLPLCTYTEAYWKADLHNLLHFLELRLQENAQFEIRSYARVIGNEIVARWCPVTWKAFSDYVLNSVTFSPDECRILKAMASGDNRDAVQAATALRWLAKGPSGLKRHYERMEFEEKLRRLSLPVPWEKDEDGGGT